MADNISLERKKLVSEIWKNWVTTISLIGGIFFTIFKIGSLIDARKKVENAKIINETKETEIRQLDLNKREIEYHKFLLQSLKEKTKDISKTQEELKRTTVNTFEYESLKKALDEQRKDYQELIKKLDR